MYTVALLILSIVFIVLTTTRWKWHPFLALIAASLLFGMLSGMPMVEVVTTINEGFGGTIGSIGIIIIAGLIIGTFLEKSGGAYALADIALRIIGKQRIHSAMAMIGYVVSIPVFADSGFIIINPLNKAMTKKAGYSLAGTAVALALGLIATHTMVPPTPGPIAAAGILEADLGKVIMLGIVTSFIALFASIYFAKWAGTKVYIDPNPDINIDEIDKTLNESPSALKSFLPIVIPIILIVMRSIAEYPTRPFGSGSLSDIIAFIGHPVSALIVGMLIAFTLPKKFDRKMLGTAGWVGEALTNAAIIILITGAGGAFGKVLQMSDLSTLIESGSSSAQLGIWLPFLIAAALKSAQGSSTVAIITTASILAPLLSGLGLDSEISKAMVVVAIGAGSAVVSHANDSFFWVVTQLSNMDVKQGYKLHTMGTAILGITAIITLSIIGLVI